MTNQDYILWFNQLSMNDLAKVGGKNASLGEMMTHLTKAGVNVPNGFATTAYAFQEFISQAGLLDKINSQLALLDVNDIEQLTQIGKQIRQWILDTELPAALQSAVANAWCQLQNESENEMTVAVRSSATAEDLPDASFAGQQETLLNVNGIKNIYQAIKTVFASLYNDRAIAYRVHQGFAHHDVALSAGIQRMVRSDLGASGVMFSMDTESGFEDVVLITSGYGLGELIVQGAINPDEFYVYKHSLRNKQPAILSRYCGTKAKKMIYAQSNEQMVTQIDVEQKVRQRFSLSDDEINYLAEQAVLIEEHYGRPMDIEWAKDGNTGKIYILQARPETVQSRANKQVLERYQLNQEGQVICTGRSIGQKIGQGRARLLHDLTQMDQLKEGDVLVTDMTDPDWEPVMKRAAAIVTNRGGRTCHAAIIARELGIPAVVGCGDATQRIDDNAEITVSCAQGDTGLIYQGLLDFDIKRIDIENMPALPVKIMLNVGNPDKAFSFRQVPNAGVGLARLEFIINRMIGIHPNALINYDSLQSDIKERVDIRIASYPTPREYYIQRLVEGISTIAAAFAPKPVIIRFSDFKSNEYANLIGGEAYEPSEENPMLGFRGAARYIDPSFRPCFAMECEAIKRVRNQMGLKNVQVMVPFVRTVEQAKQVITLLAEEGLKRGQDELKIMMMCELPSNALLAEQFLEYFDGFSIGSNDLTQLTLGLDRDSGIIADQFNERDDAVKALLKMAIDACKKQNKYIGICGQGPSDHPDLAQWLIEQNIDSVSLNPDSVLNTCLFLANYDVNR